MLALLVGLHTARRRSEPAWTGVDLPDLPFQPVASVSPQAPALRDGLASVLSHFEDPEQRQQAILACRHLPRRQAVPLLRRALTDPGDEVRLLAYAMLNAIERTLDARVQALEAALANGDDTLGRCADALAQAYWEYHYLGLAQGSVARHTLERALDSLDQALARHATAARWLLRGRICLAQGRHAAARHAFDESARRGMHADDLAPQRAELAFCSRRFDEISAQLQRLSADAATQPALKPLMEYWR